MAVTRIKNNQITDLTVNAAAKLQDYSLTSTKIANNLTYGSDLTISGNLTVQGNVTAIDTTDLVVEDPLFLLAKDQTGSPSLDIGFIGKRGTEDNIAWIWDESADQFAAVFTDSEITNTTVNILSYASVKFFDVEASNIEITGNITFSGNIVGNVTVTGNIDANNFNAVNLVTAAAVDASGNIDGGNLNSAAAVTGVTIIASGNLEGNNAVITNDVNTATVTASGNVAGGNITTGGAVDATGNVTGGNINTSGEVVATGNVTGGNLNTAGQVTATGNVAGGNITTSGAVDAAGNVTGGNITTGGAVDAVGNVTGGNITTAGVVEATGNVIGGNITTSGNVDAGNVNATGNITGSGAVFSGNVTADTFIGNISGNIDAGGANTNIQFNDDDVLAGSAAFTFDKASNAVVATGNITAGNLITGGALEATGNVTGGNITTAGAVVATGNVTGGNLVTIGNVDGANVNATSGITAGTTVVATGNVTGGNITTAGAVDATGNVTGGNLITAGVVTATGNVTGGNITTAGAVVATGNVDGGNVNAALDVTAVNVIASGNVDAATAVNTDLIVGTAVQIDSTGDIVFNPSGNITVNGSLIRDVADPELAQDAATKQYVDDAVSTGIHIHTPVDVETPTALPAATYNQGGTLATVTDTVAGNTVVFSSAINPQVNDQLWFANSFEGVVANIAYFVVSAPNTSAAVITTQYNGSPVSNITSNTGLSESVRVNSGFGANLVANAAGALTVDGYSVSAGNRVLVYNQSNAVENGIYVVTDAGNGSASWVLTRSDDANSYIPDSSVGLDEGSYVYVKFGDTGAGESYVMTAPQGAFNIGQAAVTFTQFSASQVYSANTQAGLVLNGTVFSAKVDNDTTAFDVGGNISVKAGANLVTPNIGDATGNSLTLSGNGLLSATTVSATGNVSGGNLTTAGDVTTATVTASGNITGANVNATSGVTAGTTVTATGNVTGGNITTAGAVDATGNVTGGNINTAGQVVATGNVTGGNITTAGTVVATGNVDGGNVNAVSAVTAGTTVTATGNVDGGNITTAGQVVATGNVAGGNLNTAGVVVATGNVSGGNIVTLGVVDAAGNITGGNVITAGTVIATGNVDGGNVNAVSNVTATGAVFSGNVTADTFIGNISGNIDAGGANTTIQFNDDDVLAGSAAFTFDKTSNAVVATGNITGGNLDTAGEVTATGNVTGGNITTGGEVVATGNVTGGNLNTAGTVVATGNVDGGNVNAASAITAGTTVTATGNVAGGNITTAGAVDATGNVTGGNLVTTGTADLGNIRITGNDITNFASNIITVNTAGSDIDFRVSGDNEANLFIVDAGSDTVLIGTASPTTNAALKIGTTNSILVPVGNSLQRPSTPATGMVRFNTTIDSLEFYDSDSWTGVTSDFTVIVADEFTGDGSTVQFTLTEDSTTAGTIVAINGVVQQPTTAYSVSGNVLTFTEAPESTDVIDARILTTTTSVQFIQNTSGNAKIEVSENTPEVFITGDFIPTGNGVANIGSPTETFNTIFAQATSAQYADLAEMYESDAPYEPGTVLCFGGAKEVTLCGEADSTRVAGVVSTNPSYLMNSGQTGDYVVAVALTGRVPCRVTGTVRKGDLIVSTGDGRGRANNAAGVGTVIGKALADFDGADGVIEVVVGRV